ncbi:MAG: hypothetical protein KKD33_01235 [Verrucomicrobia bacterium]|nr:hypothetical protein [Verrucomicrobiota bacterium]MBU4273821.1 hypothetical protein [Planctomycetota bacterium]
MRTVLILFFVLVTIAFGGTRVWTVKDGRTFNVSEYFGMESGIVYVWASNEGPRDGKTYHFRYDNLSDKDQKYIAWVNKMEFRTWTFRNGNIADASSVHRMSDDYQRVYVWGRDEQEYGMNFDELSPDNWVGSGWADLYAEKVKRQRNQSVTTKPIHIDLNRRHHPGTGLKNALAFILGHALFWGVAIVIMVLLGLACDYLLTKTLMTGAENQRNGGF